MDSMHWTAEESRYLKAIFTWQDRFDFGRDGARDGGSRVRDAAIKACVGDLRVLVMGAPGVGKTALLTRFCSDAFADEPDPQFMRGGRRPIRIDAHLYHIDVLEVPFQMPPETEEDSLALSPAAIMLEQALALAEAAVVVYDVCDAVSFQQACRLHERLARGLSQHDEKEKEKEKEKQAHVPKQRPTRFWSYARKGGPKSSSSGTVAASARPFALLMVGNKSDVDDSARRVAYAGGGATERAVLEASAKTGDNVSEVFVQVGREILRQREADGNQKKETESTSGEEHAARGRRRGRAAGASTDASRRPLKFMLRMLGLSFGRRTASTPVV